MPRRFRIRTLDAVLAQLRPEVCFMRRRTLPFWDQSSTWKGRAEVMAWFGKFTDWSNMGRSERDSSNNHATWWTAQVAACNLLLDIFSHVSLRQMAADGSCPKKWRGRNRPAMQPGGVFKFWPGQQPQMRTCGRSQNGARRLSSSDPGTFGRRMFVVYR